MGKMESLPPHNYFERVRDNSRWIGDAFGEFLPRKIPANMSVCVLNVGTMEEVLHVRRMYPSNPIHTYDITDPVGLP